MAVLKFELTCSAPTFASIAVRTQHADGNAQMNQFTIFPSFEVPKPWLLVSRPALGGCNERRWSSNSSTVDSAQKNSHFLIRSGPPFL
jgi:hypothetical protein